MTDWKNKCAAESVGFCQLFSRRPGLLVVRSSRFQPGCREAAFAVLAGNF